MMLPRNLHPPSLWNGMRLSVKKLMSNILEATVLTRISAGNDVFIPRIPITPFQIKRLQFPVRLFRDEHQQNTRTISESCWTQSSKTMYVGCSRVGEVILVLDGKTVNIVYPEAL